MAWLASAQGAEVTLHMPRVRPAGADALDAWLQRVRMAARLDHPHLARVAAIGVEDRWPYLLVEASQGLTLADWLASRQQPRCDELAGLVAQALEGLAYAHEAGAVHRDLQLHHLLVDERGELRVAALEVALEPTDGESLFAALHAETAPESAPQSALDPGHLREQRDRAARDVLCVGLVLHRLLAGAPPFDEPDTGRAAARLPPLGRETLRLPWSTPQPVAAALRAIVDRATARQPRQRYLSARTLLRALEGWRAAAAQERGGAVALLLERLASAGHLPMMPGAGLLAARLTRLEDRHAAETSSQVLSDLALSFELLRQANAAQVHGGLIAGPVLSMRRCIALLGVKGVRQAVAMLRRWPGALAEADAPALARRMAQAGLAGHVAQALRPAGYDAETVHLITVLQSLGRLLVQYHFAADAAQIAMLVAPVAASDSDDGREAPGLSEAAAASAVLGVELDALGVAMARHWGLADDVVKMMRRLPLSRPVRAPEGDLDLLRTLASAANEAVDATLCPDPVGRDAALHAVVQRYARSLALTMRELERAIAAARDALRQGTLADAAAAGSTFATDPA